MKKAQKSEPEKQLPVFNIEPTFVALDMAIKDRVCLEIAGRETEDGEATVMGTESGERSGGQEMARA